MLLCVGRTTKNKVISKLRLLRHALWTLFWSCSAPKVRLINYRCYWEQHVNTTRQKQAIREKARNKERWEKKLRQQGETSKICSWLQVCIRRGFNWKKWLFLSNTAWCCHWRPTNEYKCMSQCTEKMQGRLMCHYLLQTSSIMQVIGEAEILKPPSPAQLSPSASWPFQH